MAKQLNVSLAFTADTSKAKSQIMELQSSLSKVASLKFDTGGLDPTKLKAASGAAKELSIHLNNAFNAQTGNFDLSKLDRSLKTSSTNVTELSHKLLSAGTTGEQAFVKLAQTIASADRPVVTLNSKLKEMGTTLANTARWQLSSSILHGFIGAYQQAMGYVKDLNASLTDIRIVTGKSIEDMARFAEEANRAAKALSTTTNEYAQASLIFYQQGLNETEVAKRTEVTVKMANAAGQTAQVVSDQLTAVWNNFYDGSKSLEYYADVMTALGAATASSTDEIAGGLEKFAAIADTIGLSYEYAASALATITANTRQSEEVVGTALKTIFARIQGLNLGETLDDGTTLNKYSEALQKVGISIFDQAGELKDMDIILDEMGEKWGTLNKAQQTALAQTVAGVRQYNQLIALMDNWDNGDSDSMQANLMTSYNAEGTLQEQADIYAQSWEAARDRVQASLESIYKDILNDEFFIDIANGFSGLLDSLDAFIDGVGGIKTVIMGIGSFFLASFANKVQPALMNLKHTFSVVFQSAEKQAQNLTTEMNKGISDTLNSSTGMNFSDSSKAALKNAMDMNVAKGKLQSIEHNLNDTEKQRYNLELQLLQADQDAAQAVADKITKRKEEIALLAEAFDYEQSTKSLENSRGKEEQDLIDNKKAAEQAYLNDPSNATKSSLTEATNQLNEHRAATERLVNAREQYAKSLYDAYNTEMQTTQGAIESSTKLLNIQEMMPEVVQHYTKALAGMQSQPLETQRETFARLKDELEQIVGDTCPDLQKAMDAAFKSRSADAFKKNISGVMKALKEAKIPAKDLERILSSMGQGKNVKQIREQYKALGKETTDLANRQKQLKTALEEFNPKHTVTGIERITQAAAGLGQVAMLAQSCRSIFSAWGNDDLSIGEKLTTTFMSLSMIIPSAIGAFKSFNTALGGTLTSMVEAAVTQSMYNKSLASSAAQELKATAIKRLSGSADAELTKKALAKLAVKKGLCTEEQKELFVEQLLAGQKGKNVIATMAETAMIKLNTAAQNGNKIAKLALVAAEKVASIFGVTLAATKTTETGAVVANTAAWYANPIMWIALIIVGVVAALAALVAIIASVSKALSDAYNKDAIAAEKAAKAADDLKKSYEEAKQAYEDMIAAMDEYKSAREALENLTEGTQEYKDALQEANRAALELINNYPEYFGEGTYHWDNGQLIVDDEAMAQAQQKGAQKESQAYSAMMMGQAEAKKAQNKADETALRRDLAKETATAGDVIVSGIAGAIVGGIAGLFTANPLAMYQGAALGAATVNARENAQLQNSDAINKAALAYQEDKNLFSLDRESLKLKIGIEDDAIIDALLANKESVIELSNNIAAANELERAAAQQSAAELINSDARFADSKYADDMVYMAGSKYQEAHTKAQDEILESMSNKSGLKKGAQQYFENQGISSQKGFKVEDYDAKNGTVTYSYLDEEGERQEKEVTREEMSQSLAVIEAQSQMADTCYTLIGAFEQLDKNIAATGSALDEGMKAFLATGDTSQLTKEQYEAMAGMSPEQMEDYLAGLGIDDKTVTEFGYEDMAAFIGDMDLTSTGDKWKEYSDVANLNGAQDITLQSAENIHNNIAEITDFFGEEVGKQMLDLSEGFASSLDEASRAEFWNQLGQIDDFSDAEQWEAFIEGMKESGELTEEDAKLLEAYADSAMLASRATKELNFDELAESVKSLQEVMDTISEGNRNISNEQYEALAANGIDTSKFAKTIDGWRYLGDTGDFVNEVSEGIRGQFEGVQDNFANMVGTAQQASQNLIDAENALAAARAAGDVTRAAEEQKARDSVTSQMILGNMMKQLLDTVVNKIQKVWQGICDVCLGIYDFFVKIFNAIGQGISDAWNGFIGWLEGILNEIADAIVGLLDLLGIDTSAWEGFAFERMNFTPQKTADELKAEEEKRQAEADLIAATEDIVNATPQLVQSIEASADYMSEEELIADQNVAKQGLAQAQTDYDAAVAQYGEDSTQAKYYQELINSYEQQIEAYNKALDSKFIGEIMSEGFDMNELEAYADMLRETHKELDLTEEEALKLAAAQKKMDRGMKTLIDSWDDWTAALESGDLEEKSKALTKLRNGMSDIAGVDMSSLPASFFETEKNARLLEQALKGDVDALRTLMGEATKELIVQMNLDAETSSALQTAIDQTLTAIDVKDLEVGATLNDTGMYEAFQHLLDSGAVTVDEMNTILSGIGFSPVIEYKEMTLGEAKRLNQKSYIQTADGEYTEVTTEMNLKDDAKVWVPVINADKTTVKAPPAPSAYNNGNNGGGGGGGSKPKKTADARQKKSEVVDRYKEVTDQLEKANHLMSMNSTLAEGLWGSARSKKMRENLALQKQEIGLLKEKLAETEKYLNVDRQELNSAASVLGLNVQIDGDGIVTNIESVQEAMWKKREQLLDSFGSEIDETEQETLDAFDKYIERFEEAYDQYEETRQENMSTEEEILEAQLEAQQIMFDDLNQTLEENVSLIEQDLELVEYYLSKVEDDFYGMAEAAALMVGSLSSANPGEGGQLGAYLDTLEAQKAYKEELDAAYANGDINQAQYIEGLMNCQSAMIDALTSLNELDATMVGYYGETLQAAQEELSKYTDMMEHHTEVLDHYMSLLDLIGASKDWARMKTVLQTQVDVAENSAAVSKANYEMLAQEAEQKKKAWEDAQNNSNLSDYEKSVIEQQWLDAQSAANEAQSKMLEDAEAWAESLKSLLDTELAELADILEKSLSGEFGSLDNMMTAMERASSLQEEYLTTTNQVYETNKLMRTAQQEIDKTTNSVAKRRLKQYIDETEQLQNKNKLSQFELDIQKAKYDLLVAEIALEEAQQAKSTVRLQRDSEGNFGYVYTADQNEIANAQQELEDAQNALYNIGLEGANKYAESYAQTVQEMNDAITELTEKWQNGEIASKEEYERQMLALKEYYGEKLLQYSELHSIALTADSRIVDEAWTKDFAHMTTQTQQWMTNVDRYVQGVEKSMERYQAGIDRVEQYAGLDLESLKKKTEDIKKENDELAKSITKKDGVLDAIKAEITQVGDLALKYAALRKEIQGTVDDYEALLKRMGVDIDTAAAGQPPLGGGTEDPGTTDPGTTDPGTTDPGTTDPGTGGGAIKVGGKINAGSAQIYDYAGDTSGERQYFRSDPVYNVLKEQGDWIQVRHHKLSSGITGWFKKNEVAALNTGGYTGDWSGSYGKLAFLHQKELVLNAQDTENLLASMDILDKIISTIDLYSSSAQLGGMLSSPRYGGFGEAETLEQNVHIEASFPNVSDHNEIEEALNNLINRASQYAHRK